MKDIFEELKKLDLKDILGYAIESEESAKNYYTTLAENAPELVAIRFKNLAKEEEIHKKTVQNIYKENFGEEKYNFPENLPPLESSVKIDNFISLITALDTAIQNEYNAYRIYRFLASTNRDHEKVFKYLENMEMEHYEILRREKDTYETQIIDNPKIKEMSPRIVWKDVFRIH